MATPQRQIPEQPRREPQPVEERRIEERRVAPSAGGRSLFWVWIVLFIAAIVWFCGWGFGGYGGWWWGRSGAASTVQPYTSGTGPRATGTGSANTTGTATTGTANGTATGTNGAVGNGGQATAPANNGTPRSNATGSGSGQAPR